MSRSSGSWARASRRWARRSRRGSGGGSAILTAGSRARAGQAIPELFEQRGEVEFRVLEAEATLSALENERPAVLALGGGAVETPRIRRSLGKHALTVFLDVDPDTAWGRVRRSNRPLARDEEQFRALYDKRQSLYREVADVTAE